MIAMHHGKKSSYLCIPKTLQLIATVTKIINKINLVNKSKSFGDSQLWGCKFVKQDIFIE